MVLPRARTVFFLISSVNIQSPQKMKSLGLLAIILAVSSSRVSAEDYTQQADDYATMRKQAVVKCSREHNINEDAIKDIMNHIQVAQDEEVKCWVSCVMKTLGIMKERSIDWDRLEHVLISGVIEEDKAKVHQVVDKCRSQVDQHEENECEVAYSLAVCKIKHWNQFDLPKGNWEHLSA